MAERARLETPREREREETLTDVLLRELKARDQARDESNKEFIMRLCRDLSAMPEDDWKALPERVKAWGNQTIEDIQQERWNRIELDGKQIDGDAKPADDRRPSDERPRGDDRKSDERPRSDDRRPAADERPRTDERPRDERPRSDERKSDERPRGDDRRPAADERKPASADDRPKASKGGPGRPRGTGQMYEIAELVMKNPDLSEDKTLDVLWAAGIRWDKDKEKAVTGNVRTAQNMVELARKLGCWKEYDDRSAGSSRPR